MFREHVRDRCADALRGGRDLGGEENRGSEECKPPARSPPRHYDKLVLSPGAAPIRPPLPGIDLPGIFSVRTVPDAREIRAWIERGMICLSTRITGFQAVTKAKRAVVVGGGFIGLEMAENLVHLGLEVTLVEMLDQVMPPLDPEMARLVERHLEKHGVRLALNDAVAGFKQTARRLARGSDEIRQGASGGHRDPRHRRASGDRAGEDGRARDRRTRGDPRRRAHAHERPGYFRRRRCRRSQGFRYRPMGLDPARRAGEPAGPDRSRCDRRARLPLPGHPGYFDRLVFGAAVASTGVSEKAPGQTWRQGLRKNIPLPEFARGVLPGRQTARDQSHLPEIQRTSPRGAGAGPGWR